MKKQQSSQPAAYIPSFNKPKTDSILTKAAHLGSLGGLNDANHNPVLNGSISNGTIPNGKIHFGARDSEPSDFTSRMVESFSDLQLGAGSGGQGLEFRQFRNPRLKYQGAG